MTDIDVSDDLANRYDRLAAELEGFVDGAELMEYVLSASATELERTLSESEGTANTDHDDDRMRTQLEDLGYIE